MAFLKNAQINATAENLNSKISQADALITQLAAIRVELIGWQTTLANNTTDFTNADRAEYNAELTRLNNRIKNEL